LPGAEELRETWLRAVTEEDAAAAGWCARLCEDLRGAEAFAASEGLSAFLAVAMGQSMKTKSGGLMAALAQALMADMTEFKVAIFEALAAAARWPSLRGQVAGSGVLGVVTATLLAPRHPPAVKALMVRLCAVLAVDAPECVQLKDPKRDEEFAKLRGQLLSSGALEAIVGMVAPGSSPPLMAAAAGALPAFAGVGSDAATRAALSKALLTEKLLEHLPNLAPAAGSAAAGGSQQVSSGEGTADAGQEAGSEEGDLERDSHHGSDASGAAQEAEEDGGYALVQVLSALGRLAAAEGEEGADALLRPLREPGALAGLRAVVGREEGAREVPREAVEQALVSLSALGRHAGAWPVVDESLAADLARLITCNSEHAPHFLQALLEDRGRAVRLGDLRALRRSARQHRTTTLCKALDSLPSCEQCGKASESSLLVCTGCRKVEYCSRECQKTSWKAHKAVCNGAKR